MSINAENRTHTGMAVKMCELVPQEARYSTNASNKKCWLSATTSKQSHQAITILLKSPLSDRLSQTISVTGRNPELRGKEMKK